ncbi:unnamed protein product, partial [Rotaria sp. Silwood1]
LKYYTRDTKAALDLMYRRSRCLADFETANKIDTVNCGQQDALRSN